MAILVSCRRVAASLATYLLRGGRILGVLIEALVHITDNVNRLTTSDVFPGRCAVSCCRG